MGDLDIRFSNENENENKKLNNSLDVKLNNGQFEKVEEKKEPDVVEQILTEEYYENLFEEASVSGQQEISEVSEEAEDSEADGVSDDIVAQLSDEIFEEIESENAVFDDEEAEIEEIPGIEEEIPGIEEEIPETEEEIPEAEASDEIGDELTLTDDEASEPEEEASEASEAEENPGLSDEKAVISDANAVSDEKSEADGILSELSHDTQKGKYDFINLCVLVIMLLFVSLTFIFMKQEFVGKKDNELSVEALKTGGYTQNISENYYENLPMEKLMAQAEVLVKKIFGDRDVKFIKFKDSEPPDGPIDNEDIGGMVVEDDPVVTTVTTVTEEATTTGKLPQDFEITTAEQKDDDSPLFTGRPIKTTTTKVTTTLDLPETTEDTTTGKVDLIFP